MIWLAFGILVSNAGIIVISLSHNSQSGTLYQTAGWVLGIVGIGTAIGVLYTRWKEQHSDEVAT